MHGEKVGIGVMSAFCVLEMQSSGSWADRVQNSDTAGLFGFEEVPGEIMTVCYELAAVRCFKDTGPTRFVMCQPGLWLTFDLFTSPLPIISHPRQKPPELLGLR